MFDQNLFFRLLEKLAAVEGPSLFEGPRRMILEEFFKDNGVPHSRDKAGNLIVKHGAGPWSETAVFDAHMDVVQKGYAELVTKDEEKISGLGVADNLTAVTMLAMFASSLQRRDEGRLFRPMVFLFSVGEEGHGNLKGVRQFVSDHAGPPHAFISFDLSFEEYSVCGLGSARYKVEVRCPGGHSWENRGTKSAIDILIQFVSGLKTVFNEYAEKYPKEVSFNIGTIKGGEGINSIAREASAAFEFRSVHGWVLEKLQDEVGRWVDEFRGEDGLTMVCEATGTRPAAGSVEPEKIEPVVLDVYSKHGVTTQPVVRSTNINATLDAGWPSLCMGLCRCGRFHSPQEYVLTDSLEKGWNILKDIVKGMCSVT
jgi:acetylornithine deacetylase/succinyl-diaminopimelate desuccinylase-like protein